MPDFKFIQSKLTKKWTILAPRRAQRPDEAKGTEKFCPFCPETLKETPIYSQGEVKVLNNKYPFAPIHEVIVHSNDHHKNFGELDLSSTELIFKVYRQRFQSHKDKGQVYIFHNRGEAAGESLEHPHSQLVVIPTHVNLETPPLEEIEQNANKYIQTELFVLFCPSVSQWPDEVWIKPVKKNTSFDSITDEEITDLSKAISKLIRILESKLGEDFPYNFYIYPANNWYLRILPRTKSLGGFELGTNVFVNIENPEETIEFLRKNW